MMRNCVMLLAVMCAVLIISGVASAGVPMLLTHQGRLLDGSDNPVDGTRDLTFRIYDVETGGVPLWTETHFDVPVSNGLYRVILGSGGTLTGDLILNADPVVAVGRFLEIEVESDGPMSPRTRMVSSPYSIGASRVSGDLQTSPGQLSLSGMSGSTTATIRATEDPGVDASETLHLSGSTTATIRAASSAGAQVHLSGMSGSTTGTIRMQASPDSAVSAAGLDLNGDGVPDVATAMEAIESRNILKSYFETGDKPSQARFVTQYGESDMELSVTEVDELHTATVSADSSGSELRVLSMPLGGGISGSTTGTIRVGHGGGGGGGGLGGDAFTVTGTFQDATSEDVTEMKAARKDITINLRHSDLSGVDGDQTAAMTIDSLGSEMRIGSGPLSGMSGSTTGTIRVGLTNVPGSGVSQPAYTATGNYSDGTNESSIEQVSNAAGAISRWKGMSGSTTGTIRMAASSDSAASIIVLEADVDGDGTVENRSSNKCVSDGSALSCESRFGNGPRQTTSMDGSFSQASSRVVTDLDDDGVADVACVTLTDSAHAERTLSMDSDDDGFADHEIQDHVDVDFSRSTWTGHSGSTTGTIRMASFGDSSEQEISVIDVPTGTEMKVKEKAGKSKCSSNLRSMTPTDSMDIEHSCDATEAVSRWKGMSGSTTGTIRMAASPDSAGAYLDHDDDGDGFSEAKITITVRDAQGNPIPGMVVSADTDDDGDADNEAELSCDADGARSILSGMSGSTTGTIRMAASPDSAVLDLGISGSTTSTIRIQTSSSGTANPIEHSSGAHLTAGGDWTNASDENLKENFSEVDAVELLEKIESLPIQQWNYKNEDASVIHIGPTAQNFKKAFGVGADDKSISTIDPSGIALAAIKQLIKENEELKKRINAIEKQIKK